MNGYAVGGACYSAAAEAAAAACSSIVGVTGAGVVSCEAPGLPGQLDGVPAVLSYTLRTGDGGSRASTLSVQRCEPYDADYWTPILAAFLLAGVLILCARSLYTRVFQGGTV